MRSRLALAGTLLLVLSGGGNVRAESLYNKPVYNPESKSYFELYTPALEKIKKYGMGEDIRWRQANSLAMQRIYKGVRGRLAVVNTKQIHEFLRDTFQPAHAAWIGLRYWCKYHKLMWVTGDIQNKTDFSAWGRIWNEEAVRAGSSSRSVACPRERAAYNPVHYWPVTEGFNWNANGSEKGFYVLFVEYPTGKP